MKLMSMKASGSSEKLTWKSIEIISGNRSWKKKQREIVVSENWPNWKCGLNEMQSKYYKLINMK